jgi:hypothetical protein
METSRDGWHWFTAVFLVLTLAAPLTGCAGFAKGVTEAIIGEPGKKEDTRKCDVRGRSFEGLEAKLKKHEKAAREGSGDRPVLKVLMVHGIGSHQPGYSTRLSENLVMALSLNRFQEQVKEITLINPEHTYQDLGVLRVTRYLNAGGSREMIFAELTWDPIVEKEKQSISFDNSGEYSFRRAPLNNTLKEFINDTIPDVLMFNGTSRKKIHFSVSQSLCWLMSESWASLPAKTTAFCDGNSPTSLNRINDDFVFITHSLGSRITVDALQWIAATISHTSRCDVTDKSEMPKIAAVIAATAKPSAKADMAEIKRQLQE